MVADSSFLGEMCVLTSETGIIEEARMGKNILIMDVFLSEENGTQQYYVEKVCILCQQLEIFFRCMMERGSCFDISFRLPKNLVYLRRRWFILFTKLAHRSCSCHIGLQSGFLGIYLSNSYLFL